MLTDKQLAWWEKVRSRGYRRYVVVDGILLWGLPTGVLWALIMSWLQPGMAWPARLLALFVGFPLAGYFFGRSVWNRMEAEYARSQPGDAASTSPGVDER